MCGPNLGPEFGANICSPNRLFGLLGPLGPFAPLGPFGLWRPCPLSGPFLNHVGPIWTILTPFWTHLAHLGNHFGTILDHLRSMFGTYFFELSHFCLSDQALLSLVACMFAPGDLFMSCCKHSMRFTSSYTSADPRS